MSDDQVNEEWRDIPEYPGYQVSDLGRIRSSLVSKNRKLNGDGWRFLKQTNGLAGYLRVALCKDGHKPRTIYVHHLVLRTFVGPRPDGKECCHWNGDPHDNRLCNLRWDTRTQNVMDMYRCGHNTARGERLPSAKLTEELVREIRSLKGLKTTRAIAKHFGIGKTVVGNILRGEDWKHIT